MTIQQIYEAAKTNKDCIFYFGNDVTSFHTASTALFGEEKTKKFLRGINEHKRYYRDTELELVLRTDNGYFDGWNILDSIDFYKLDLRNRTCGRRKEAKVFDCRHKKEVII